jgi:hypothetical protein
MLPSLPNGWAKPISASGFPKRLSHALKSQTLHSGGGPSFNTALCERDGNFYLCSTVGARFDAKRTPDGVSPLPHADQPQTPVNVGVLPVEAGACIAHLKLNMPFNPA